MIKNCPMRHENGNCLPAGGFCTANKDICEALHKAYKLGRESQSEITHCKDCIDWGTNDCTMFQGVNYDPDYDWTNPEGYCHMAERRTDGKTT